VTRDQLRRALLDVPPDSVDRARLLVELAMMERGCDPAAAAWHVFYAAPLLPTARDRAEALTRLAPATLVHEPMQDLLTEVAAELGAGELAPRLEARLRYATLDDPAALDAATHQLTGLGTDTELLTVLTYAATVGAKTPASEAARLMVTVLDREPATPEHVHTALPLAALTLVAADRVAPLLPWLDTALATAQGAEQAVVRAERALALVYLGRAREARSLALEVAGSPLAATALSMVALELRDPELTNRVLAQRHEDVFARLLRVSATALAGDFPGALAQALECGRRLDRAGWVNPVLFRWQLSAALLHDHLGDREAALALATDARTRALAWGAASGIGRASRVLGHLTPDQPGVDLLRDAVEVLEGSDNLLERAKARLALGTRLRSVGDPGSGEVLRAARGLASEAGAPWLAGGLLAVAPGRPLTRSETRVVELATGDRTNHEIAELLGITCRAVEKHLTNSFRKLGIRRRTELAGALAAGQRDTGHRRGEAATPEAHPLRY
jgi:DNA-binding CsgD family transcriptional regulator